MTGLFRCVLPALALLLLEACAAKDDWVCGGSYKSTVEMEKALGNQAPRATTPAATARY